MPDFGKDLKPALLNTQDDAIRLDNPLVRGSEGGPSRPTLAGPKLDPLDAFFGKGPVITELAATASAKELYDNRRYSEFNPFVVDLEDQKAYGQSVTDKAVNGLVKGLNLVGTTIAGGFGTLYGIAKSPFTGRLADIWDNEALRTLDDWNTEVDQNFLPNYYTDAEKKASWYSTDNWFKANFLFDKLIKNSGFAVGAMVSGNIANAGLLRAGAAIGKAATALESAQSFKLFTPLLKNTARAFSSGKNIEAATLLEKEISSIADLAAKSSKLGELAKSTNTLAKFNDVGRRTAIAAYSSAGEASFEALSTSKEYREGLINKYKEENGVEPSGAALEQINQESEKIGKVSFFGNLAILGATEYVQLPRLLGSSYSADKQAANSLLGKVDDIALKDGKYVGVKPTTKFGKLKDRVGGVTKYIFDPKEGMQEGLQFALQVGTQNYYNKAFRGDNVSAWTDGFLYGLVGEDERGEGKGTLVSKEGIEGIILGGITGAAMQARGIYKESKALQSNTQKFLTMLNGSPTFKAAYQDKLASLNRSVV